MLFCLINGKSLCLDRFYFDLCYKQHNRMISFKIINILLCVDCHMLLAGKSRSLELHCGEKGRTESIISVLTRRCYWFISDHYKRICFILRPHVTYCNMLVFVDSIFSLPIPKPGHCPLFGVSYGLYTWGLVLHPQSTMMCQATSMWEGL
jgi:hypothetical protein